MAVSVGLVAQVLEKIAPKSWAEDWDNVGLLVGEASASVERVLIALDGTVNVIEEAREIGAQLIITHHPLMFRPLKNLRNDNLSAQVPIRALKYGISYYASHTNLDQSRLSASWSIGEALKLRKLELLAETAHEELVKLVVFVPEPQVEDVRLALVRVGVGDGVTEGPGSDLYSECFFQSVGEGMFRPLQGANPAIGELGELTKVNEVKLEGILPKQLVSRAIKALRQAHPYEEPAYDLIPLHNNGKSRGYGVIGYLDKPEKLREFWPRVLSSLTDLVPSELLQSKAESGLFGGVRVAGDLDKEIRKVAIANGSGGSFASKAVFKGADLFITGDIDYHAVLDSLEAGMAIADLGHYWSELPMLKNIANCLAGEKQLQGIDICISKANSVPWVEVGKI